MTNLIEKFVIEGEINHCTGGSSVLGGPNDLRTIATDMVRYHLRSWLVDRLMDAVETTEGVTVKFTNTGLEEVPEETGGDN